MPPKIRELESKLKKAGFEVQSAKGSHRKWKHSTGATTIISGATGDDAKPYQIRQTEYAIEKAKGK